MRGTCATSSYITSRRRSALAHGISTATMEHAISFAIFAIQTLLPPLLDYCELREADRSVRPSDRGSLEAVSQLADDRDIDGPQRCPDTRIAEAKASDHNQILPPVFDFPKIGMMAGRPQELPDESYADRRYDSEATKEFLRWPE
jgi:hypothetical protein